MYALLKSTPCPYNRPCSSLGFQEVALFSLQSPHIHHTSVILSCTQMFCTPCNHTCHTHCHSGLWHAASIMARLHSVHFSPHMSTGQHPADLCVWISVIICEHLTASNGPLWESPLLSIVKLIESESEFEIL